jgi:hypothetical protein
MLKLGVGLLIWSNTQFVMHFMRYYLFFLLINLPIYAWSVASKESDSTRHRVKNESLLHIGGGGYRGSTLDRAMSPHLYRGFGGGAIMGYVYRTSFWSHEVSINGQYAEQTNQFEFSNNTLDNIAVEVNYFVGVRVYELFNGHVRANAGLSWYNQWSLRINNAYTNNAFYNDYYSSIKPTLALRADVPLFGRILSLYQQAMYSSMSYVVRPIFASTTHRNALGVEDDGLWEFISSGEFQGMSIHRSAVCNTTIEYGFKNGNKVRLGYQWNYQHNKGINPVQLAGHQLNFGVMMNLGRL